MTTDNRGGMKDPRKERKGEKIGGGYFVFRRGERTGRIRPAMWPFEHPNVDSAEWEAARLAEANPGQTFVVVELAGSFVFGPPSAEPAAPPPNIPMEALGRFAELARAE